MADRRKTMGNDETGPVLHESIQGLLNHPFSLVIHTGCRLIQNQDWRIFEQRSGDGDPLFFADT